VLWTNYDPHKIKRLNSHGELFPAA
jgi:hypothetical protein